MNGWAVNWANVVLFVTGAVALYGAGLSTFNTWSAWREKRRIVKVSVSYGFPVVTTPGDLGPYSLFLTARNPSRRPTTLVGCGLQLPDGKTMPFLDPGPHLEFPLELTEGKAANALRPVQAIGRTLAETGYGGSTRVRGFFRDALGETHYSISFKVSITDWAKG
ncbi:MAG: hypothetical protein ABIK89_24980 [Planctomycetota bacterium]